MSHSTAHPHAPAHLPALTVVIASDRAQDFEAIVGPWTAHLTGMRVPAEVLVATGVFGASVKEQLRHARGEYVLIVDGATAPGRWFEALWEQRLTAGLIIGTRADPDAREAGDGPVRRFALRMYRRLLSLPVLPDASVILARCAALGTLPEADDRFEWLLEAIVLAHSDGWPVRTLNGMSAGRPQTIRLQPAALWRLWVLRNSAFSADYDERAFNSVVPLQRYWQRTRHRIIHGWVDPETRILDVGCGSSRIVQDLPRAVGLDVQMKKLRRISPRTQKVVQATLTQLPFRCGAFETLICSQVIEHVPEPLVDWCEMNRVLSLGGIFVVGTPDYATVAWPALERVYGIVHPKGYVHEHINQYTAASLRHALESHGFEVITSAYVGRAELIIKARKVAPCANK